MKILHISQYYNDGYGYQENLLPFYQKKLGHDIVHITSDRMSSFVKSLERIIGSKKYYENGVKIIRLPVSWEFKSRFVVFKSLYKLLETEKPDYIFHHGLTSPSLFAAVRYKRKNPNIFLVVDNHSDINISGRSRIWLLIYYRFFWKTLLLPNYKYIDLIFGVTPLRCFFPAKYLGAPKNKIRLLPIGTDIDNVPTSDKITLRKKYNVDDNKIIFITGGKITSNKRMDKILDAFKLLNSNKAKLIVFGKIQDKLFEKKLKSLKNSMFLGWKNRLETLELLKLSDVAIWNTQHTTLIEDSVVVETPLILRYYGTTAHFIEGNGFYLYSNSVKEIYEKMNFIIENPTILPKMKDQSKKIKNLLSYANIAKESVEYFYDQKPKLIHKTFMNEKFLDERYKYFEKIY